MRGWLLSVILLTLVYCLTVASFAVADVAMGAAISAGLLFVFRGFLSGERPDLPGGMAGALIAFFPFAGAVLWDVVKGTWKVTLVTLGIEPLRSPGIVAVPIGARTPVGVAVSALATTLSPGTYLVDVDRGRGVMLIHTIDASDPEEVRREHQSFYDRYQKRVFP